MLAMKIGGTPWQWREQAAPEDWATGVKILQAEAERIREMNAGR